MTNRPGWSRPAGIACGVLVCAFAGLSVQGAGSVMTAKPEEVGLSTERLARIHEAAQRTSTRARYRER